VENEPKPQATAPSPEQAEAARGVAEAKLKAIEDQIKVQEANLTKMLEFEKALNLDRLIDSERIRDDEVRKANAIVGAMGKDEGHGHDTAGHGHDPLGTMIIGAIAAGTVAMELVEPVATAVEGALKLGEEATRHEAVKQTEELRMLHEQQKQELQSMTTSEIYREAPSLNKEAWLEHKLKQQELEEKGKLAEFEARNPKAYELNREDREMALQEQARVRGEYREQAKGEKERDAEKMREQAEQRKEQQKEREPEVFQKPQWKDAERAEAMRREFEEKKLRDDQERIRQATVDNLGKMVADKKIDTHEAQRLLEEQRKQFERALEKQREEARDRADRQELLYRGPPSERF
jgi:hypothetical protein